MRRIKRSNEVFALKFHFCFYSSNNNLSAMIDASKKFLFPFVFYQKWFFLPFCCWCCCCWLILFSIEQFANTKMKTLFLLLPKETSQSIHFPGPITSKCLFYFHSSPNVLLDTRATTMRKKYQSLSFTSFIFAACGFHMVVYMKKTINQKKKKKCKCFQHFLPFYMFSFSFALYTNKNRLYERKVFIYLQMNNDEKSR